MYDGVFRRDFKVEGDKLYSILTQPAEDSILSRNKLLRSNPGSINDLSFGRQLATIPINMYEKWCRENPELTCSDRELRQKTLLRLLRTPEGQACLVQDSTAKSSKVNKSLGKM